MIINENDLRKIIKKALLEFRIEKISGTRTNDLARLDIGEKGVLGTMDPRAKLFANLLIPKLKEEFDDIRVTSTKRTFAEHARVVFQNPYKIDVLIRAHDPDIAPGDYFFAGNLSSEETKAKVNAALEAIGKTSVENGVYIKSSKTRKAFTRYEQISNSYRQKNNISSSDSFWTDENVISTVKKRTEKVWGQGGMSKGGHGRGQAMDLAGIPLSQENENKINDIVAAIQNSNSSVKKYVIIVKRETDHYHIGIIPK